MSAEIIGQPGGTDHGNPEIRRITPEQRRANHEVVARRETTPLDGVIDERNLGKNAFGIDPAWLEQAATPDEVRPYIYNHEEKIGKLVVILAGDKTPFDSRSMNVISNNLPGPIKN